MDSAKTPRTTCGSARLLNGSLLNNQQRRSVRDEELCQLEDEIKKAYVLKGLHAQLAEQEADRMASDIQTKIADEIARYQTAEANEERDRAERLKRERSVTELKDTLDRQLEEKRVERSLVEEEERRERQLLFELDRVREERELYEKLRNKELLAEQLMLERHLHQGIREINKQKLEQLEAEEALKNRKYVEELDARAERLKRMRLEARKKREETINEVAKLLLELQAEQSERRQLITDIVIEEVRFDAELEAREAELRRRQKTRDYAEQLAEQMRFEDECKKRFLEREREFTEAVMAKVMESERMERLSAEVRRRRRVEYRAELERLVAERERARADELVRLRRALEEERLQEESEREQARRARMALLEQHIDHIADFMSRKSLYDEERGVMDGRRREKNSRN